MTWLSMTRHRPQTYPKVSQHETSPQPQYWQLFNVDIFVKEATPFNMMEHNHVKSVVNLFHSLVSLFLLLLGATSVGCQTISMIGYDLSKVTGVASTPSRLQGRVLLLDNAAQNLGIIFAFSVLVDSPNPFTLQLYHADGSGRSYRLGQEFTVTPSVQEGLEDIYIESLLNRRCVVIYPGDRLALYVPSDVPSVQSNFNDSSLTLLNSLNRGAQMGDALIFDTTYPYSFRAAAYYIVSNDSSLNSSSDTVDCPFGTLIPRELVTSATVATTTPPPITGAQGVIGATGRQGATGYTGMHGVPGSTGQPGASGWTGPQGYTGATGDFGATGWMGARGATGGTGAIGSEGPSEIGDRGLPGPRGPSGLMGHNITVFLNQPASPKQAAQLSDESSDSTDPYWSSSRAIWATYLWTAIVSFLLLIVVIVIIVVACIQRSFPGALRSSPVTAAESRTNIMDDEPSNYSDLGTIEY